MGFQVGDSVICMTPLKMLPDGEIGNLLSVHGSDCNHPNGWVVIGYPQFYPVEDGKGGYRFSKYVYIRSADIDSLEHANKSE